MKDALELMVIENLLSNITFETRIDDNFVRNVFSVDVDKVQVQDKKYLGDLEPSVENGMNIEEYKIEVLNCLTEYPRDAFLESYAYGYDGAETIQVFQHLKREETDREFYNRIKSLARDIKKSLVAENKAKIVLGM